MLNYHVKSCRNCLILFLLTPPPHCKMAILGCGMPFKVETAWIFRVLYTWVRVLTLVICCSEGEADTHFGANRVEIPNLTFTNWLSLGKFLNILLPLNRYEFYSNSCIINSFQQFIFILSTNLRLLIFPVRSLPRYP